MPGQTETDRFLSLVVEALDYAQDEGIDWRWVHRALLGAWTTHPGTHAWAPREGVPDDEHAVTLSAP